MWMLLVVSGGFNTCCRISRRLTDQCNPSGYKWLKYVPSSVIKTAHATEWKLQGWMLGKPPRGMTPEGIGHDAHAHSTYDAFSGTGTIGGRPVRLLESHQSQREVPFDELPLGNFGNGDAADILPRGLSESSQPTNPPRQQTRRFSVVNAHSRTNNSSPTSIDASSSLRHGGGETSLVLSLLQASHAEALSGGTADLLTILGKDSKPWGFRYKDVRHLCKIWYGERDDKIPEKSMTWLVEEMTNAELITLPNEGHNLMTSSTVMLAVLESLAQDAKRVRRRS